jgi:hypothetical protein
MASALDEFGDPVSDRTLVMKMIRGLNGTFLHMMSHVKLHRPFSMFNEARTLLFLEEIDLKDVVGDEPPTPPSLFASGGSSDGAPHRPPGGQAGGYSGAPSGQAGDYNSGNSGNGGNGGQRNNCRRGRGKNNGGGVVHRPPSAPF